MGFGFVDDSCTLIGGTNLDEMMSRTKKVVNDQITWGHSCGLKFNPDKTVCIIFTKAKNIIKYPNTLIVGGKNVEFSTTIKYLGVTLDHKRLWTTHITQAVQKAKVYLFMIQKNVNTTYGPRADNRQNQRNKPTTILQNRPK